MPKVGSTKPDRRFLGGKKVVKVACIQAPQIVFNKEKSIEVACKKIKEAGANGAELVAFSESYIPVYANYYNPGFHNVPSEMARWVTGLYDNSIVIPSDDTDRIANACKDAGVYCVMGVNELDDDETSRTMYNTQIIFGADGTILGRHRKIKPTHAERVFWGEGDGSDLGVYKTSIGRIGSLVCWEHHTTVIKVAQMLMGEEFHIANWPGTYNFKDPNIATVGVTDPHKNDGITAAREYAFEAGCFVLSVHGLLREEDFEPEYKDFINSKDINFDYANGGSCVINPFGDIIAGPVYNEDTIIYADCCADEIKCAKLFFDGMGHYSKPSVAKVLLNTEHQTNLNIVNSNTDVVSSAPDYKYLKQLSEEFEIKMARLEKLAEKIESMNK